MADKKLTMGGAPFPYLNREWTDKGDIARHPVQAISPFEINEGEEYKIAGLFEMMRTVDEEKDKIENACRKFTDSVISRVDSGAIFVSWDFNNRGSLIEITYTVPDSYDNLEKRKECVSFKELAPYVENVFRDR